MSNFQNIHSLADLQRERAVVRAKINAKEEILREHYSAFTEKFKPFMKIVNFVSGNRIFKGVHEDKENSGSEWISTLLQILVAGTAGTFIFKRSKRNLFKTLLAYLLDQGVKFVQEKDLTEHFEKIKEWISKFKKETEEEVSSEQ